MKRIPVPDLVKVNRCVSHNPPDNSVRLLSQLFLEAVDAVVEQLVLPLEQSSLQELDYNVLPPIKGPSS